jgi:hypothetical protein
MVAIMERREKFGEVMRRQLRELEEIQQRALRVEAQNRMSTEFIAILRQGLLAPP